MTCILLRCSNRVVCRVCNYAGLHQNLNSAGNIAGRSNLIDMLNVVLSAQPRSLMEECRRTIRRQLGREGLRHVDDLRIPPILKRYLMYH